MPCPKSLRSRRRHARTALMARPAIGTAGLRPAFLNFVLNLSGKCKVKGAGRRPAVRRPNAASTLLDSNALLTPHSGTACRAPTEILCLTLHSPPEAAMPVVPTTAYSQAEDALTLARALMNDSSGAVFTDALLMPL